MFTAARPPSPARRLAAVAPPPPEPDLGVHGEVADRSTESTQSTQSTEPAEPPTDPWLAPPQGPPPTLSGPRRAVPPGPPGLRTVGTYPTLRPHRRRRLLPVPPPDSAA